MAKQQSRKRTVIRKIIVWAVLLTVGVPNIVLGEPALKVVGLICTALVIWWDVTASRKEKKWNT